MALVNCKECGTEVSDKAYECPKCGAKLRKLERTMFGKIIKYAFIGFNILMLIYIVVGANAGSKAIEASKDEYEKAGAAVGSTLGVMFIIGIWIAGDVILGLMTILTRPKK